jgi:hypothetical protein
MAIAREIDKLFCGLLGQNISRSRHHHRAERQLLLSHGSHRYQSDALFIPDPKLSVNYYDPMEPVAIRAMHYLPRPQTEQQLLQSHGSSSYQSYALFIPDPRLSDNYYDPMDPVAIRAMHYLSPTPG